MDATTKYLTGPQVRARYSISEATFWRWERNDKLAFPKPMRIGQKKFYAESEIVDWERHRAARAAQ